MVGKKFYIFKEDRKNLNEESRRSKITRNFLNPLKVTALSSSDDNFIRNYFICSNVFLHRKLNEIGKSYVKISCYSPNPNYFDKNLLIPYFKIEIWPINYKMRKYKFILTSLDFSKFFNLKNFDLSSKRQVLQSFNNKFFSKLHFYKDSLYKRCLVPLDNQFDLDISINKIEYEENNMENFLIKKKNTFRVIFQEVKKIGKNFTIFTIKKRNDGYANLWQIHIYIQKSKKKFFSTFTR